MNEGDQQANQRLKNLLAAQPKKALTYLYDRCYKGLVYMSLSKTHDEKASEDIVQEAFVDLWKNHKVIASKDIIVIPYLFKMVKNRSVTHYYRKLRRNENPLHVTEKLQELRGALQVEMVIWVEEHPLWQLIATFPPRETECLKLKHIENMTNDQIAIHLSISVKAVEKNITRAYKRLRQYDPALLRRTVLY